MHIKKKMSKADAENLIYWAFLKSNNAHKLKETQLFNHLEELLEEEKLQEMIRTADLEEGFEKVDLASVNDVDESQAKTELAPLDDSILGSPKSPRSPASNFAKLSQMGGTYHESNSGNLINLQRMESEPNQHSHAKSGFASNSSPIAEFGSYQVIEGVVRQLVRTNEKGEEHDSKQAEFSKRYHKQKLIANVEKAANADLRKNQVDGVDSTHNVFTG